MRSARGVIDLRSYAARTKPAGDWLSGRMAPAFADADAVVTAIAPLGHGGVSSLPADEFLTVLSGTLSIKSGGGTILVPASRSAVLPAGTSFEWTASEATVVVIDDGLEADELDFSVADPLPPQPLSKRATAPPTAVTDRHRLMASPSTESERVRQCRPDICQLGKKNFAF